MKIKSFIIIAALFGALLSFVIPAIAHAQDAAPPAAETQTVASDVLTTFIVGLSAKYPVLVAIFGVMGMLRAIFKPIVAAIQAHVKKTESTRDDEYVAKVEASPVWKAVTWLLDWGASVKVGPQLKK